MKEHRYQRIRKAILASAGTGLMASMLLVGGRYALAETLETQVPSYTQNTTNKGVHVMRRWNSKKKIGSLAENLGLDKVKTSEGLKSGKNLKQILQENGIVPDQIHKAMTLKKSSRNKNWKK